MNIKFKIRTNWQTAEPKISHALNQVRFQPFQSFDLKLAEAEQDEGCPYHSPKNCDCEIIVLLLYSDDYSITTLVGYCRDRLVEFSLPECSNSREISEKISQAFLNAQKLLEKEQV
jgi:hypothetical protein